MKLNLLDLLIIRDVLTQSLPLDITSYSKDTRVLVLKKLTNALSRLDVNIDIVTKEEVQ